MRNPGREKCFRFKQFDVVNDRSAMKVGTDGVLLGAWAFDGMEERGGTLRVLDVGTGSGVIGLMLAQRLGNAMVRGIDVEAGAVDEARENFVNSPWGQRLEAMELDFCNMAGDGEGGWYDLLVSNPPFFSGGSLAPEAARRLARHEGELNFASLMKGAGRLLKPGGRVAVVAPYEALEEIVFEGELNGLGLRRLCVVRTVGRKPPRRVLLELERGGLCAEVERGELCIHDEAGGYTADYIRLTREFYLKF